MNQNNRFHKVRILIYSLLLISFINFLSCANMPFISKKTDKVMIINDDPELTKTLLKVREEFLSSHPVYTYLNFSFLLRQKDGSWKRASFNGDTLSYPASTVKLAYLAAAMHWCRQNNKPYDSLESSVKPMIEKSDNVATGVVVDAITGAPNDLSITSETSPGFNEFLEKRKYTENFLAKYNLLGKQNIINKTYPSNSGNEPKGAELALKNIRGANSMQPDLAAKLMMYIAKGIIEPGATSYMRKLLTHDRFEDYSVLGFGLPPGSIYENKLGVTFYTPRSLSDIAYIVLPNGKEFVMAIYSDGTEVGAPFPHDVSSPGIFCEMIIEKLNLDKGNPIKIKYDNSDAIKTSNWKSGSDKYDKFASDYIYKNGGDGKDKVIWNLKVPKKGKYEVCVWYTAGQDRAKDAPYTVNHEGGSTIVNINQQFGGGRWIRLGEFDFKKGQGTVVLSDNIADKNQVISADAVKITLCPKKMPKIK